MRVKQCCCGCSLRTGTLILLWLDVITQASSVLKGVFGGFEAGAKYTFLNSATLGWGCIILVIAIFGIVAVEKHRPSYLLPYLSMVVVSLIIQVLFLMIVWIGGLALRDQIIHAVIERIGMSHPRGSHVTPEEIRNFYNSLMTIFTLFLIFCIALTFYWYVVIYSYYKQMQEEDKGIYNPPTGTGIVYAAPSNQTNGYDHPPAYGPQPTIVPYPQQNAGYPNLQQNAGYPYPQQNFGYPPQKVGYPPQNVGYPQEQYPNYPEKQ